jgi:hypothetical protein
MRRITISLFCLIFLGICFAAEAAPPRILKVLQHLLDKDGRNSRAPSLYERDAYQAYLRKNPDKVTALRFDVQWKARHQEPGQFVLRLEVRATKAYKTKPLVLEQPVVPKGLFSHWSAITIQKDEYQGMGEIVAWRITLLKDGRSIAEQKSFLW